MAGDRVAREMDDDVRGWPLGEDKIRAKYFALVKRDLERKMLRAKDEILPYEQMLEHIPVTLPKSRSTREVYSRARSLQRVLRRAGLRDTTGKGSQSVPIPSPSSSLEDHHHSLARTSVDPEIVLALDVPKPVTVSAPCSTKSQQQSYSETQGKRTKFLAKQFKLISNSNTTPRLNIKILGKPRDETKVTEKDQLQERIRVHDCDRSSNPSFLNSVPAQSSSLCLSSPAMSGKTATSPSEYAHANSPSSIISEASIPETVMSSPENEPTGRKLTMLTSRRAGASNSRERWMSREIFGSFDFGVELDIDGTVYPGSESSWSLDGSTSSGMRSPRQSSATSSSDDDHHAREAHRMKVTSPSSLFRDGPRKPQLTAPNVPRKISRKLSTSFNKRRSKQVQSQPRDESLSTRSPENTLAVKESSKASLTVEIAGLLSGFRSNGRVAGVISQQQATMAFQDDIAHLMLDRSESNEIGDIEEFLDGYMRLHSPFYLEVVEEFFRNVSDDCYKRPLDVKKPKLPPKVPRR